MPDFDVHSPAITVDADDVAAALAAPRAVAPPPAQLRESGALTSPSARRRYWAALGVLILLASGVAVASLAWANPMPVGSDGFWRIAQLRASSLLVILVVTFAQGIATIAFQTVTTNRILTPSIMGFESLYRVVQTGAVFFLGVAGIGALTGVWQFLLHVALMVGFAALLYGWLLTGKKADLQVTLLVGIVLGGGLGALATFMQRLLTPSEFDVLTARLIGSIATARVEYLTVAIPLVALAGGAIWWRARTLNVLAMGRDTALNLGVNQRRETMLVLMLTAVLMAVSTALVGPMTFLGFLVAMLAYQLADTFDHRRIFPVAWLTGFVVLGGAHFLLKHVFYAEGSVGIIVELVGGSVFLAHILKKGRL